VKSVWIEGEKKNYSKEDVCGSKKERLFTISATI
jgi:hypothetical protein